MKKFTRPAPVQRELMLLLESSPLPWATDMIRGWLGLRVGRCRTLLNQMKIAGRIWAISTGFYTSVDRFVPKEIEQEGAELAIANVTFSPRGPGDVVTDDMLAKYGFNL